MQLKTILNRVERYKSFVYGEPRWASDALRLTLEVPIEPRANGRPICSCLRFACSDMWKPYLTVLAEQAGGAIHVLDRFHIMKQLGEAIDQVRAGEARRMKQDGYEPVLKHSRWCLLKRPQNLSERQTVKLDELLRYNLQSVRAYLNREDFPRFWQYQPPGWAGRFLDEWCTRVMLAPVQREWVSRACGLEELTGSAAVRPKPACPAACERTPWASTRSDFPAAK